MPRCVAGAGGGGGVGGARGGRSGPRVIRFVRARRIGTGGGAPPVAFRPTRRPRGLRSG